MTDPIVVVGSANLDIVVPVPHQPARGETVLGGDHARVPGGKGANQAVAASRLGGSVAFIGRVGIDPAGEELRNSLVSSGVNCAGLTDINAAPSGIALITVGADGDNAIVVSPGANHHLRPVDVAEDAQLKSASVVLLQLEIPMDTNIAAARHADGFVVLDPAPAPADGLPSELLREVDLLAPNETELAILAGREVDPTNNDDLAAAARSLGVPYVIVTLGSRGALVVDATSARHVPAPPISAVDTTAAGDAFRAAVAVEIARGDAPSPSDTNSEVLHAAAGIAVRVGAATALRFGAQPSLPTAEEVDELLE